MLTIAGGILIAFSVIAIGPVLIAGLITLPFLLCGAVVVFVQDFAKKLRGQK